MSDRIKNADPLKLRVEFIRSKFQPVDLSPVEEANARLLTRHKYSSPDPSMQIVGFFTDNQGELLTPPSNNTFAHGRRFISTDALGDRRRKYRQIIHGEDKANEHVRLHNESIDRQIERVSEYLESNLDHRHDIDGKAIKDAIDEYVSELEKNKITLKGSSIWLNALPCSGCSLHNIVPPGTKRVYFDADSLNNAGFNERWLERLEESVNILEKAGIEIVGFSGEKANRGHHIETGPQRYSQLMSAPAPINAKAKVIVFNMHDTLTKFRPWFGLAVDSMLREIVEIVAKDEINAEKTKRLREKKLEALVKEFHAECVDVIETRHKGQLTAPLVTSETEFVRSRLRDPAQQDYIEREVKKFESQGLSEQAIKDKMPEIKQIAASEEVLNLFVIKKIRSSYQTYENIRSSGMTVDTTTMATLNFLKSKGYKLVAIADERAKLNLQALNATGLDRVIDKFYMPASTPDNTHLVDLSSIQQVHAAASKSGIDVVSVDDFDHFLAQPDILQIIADENEVDVSELVMVGSTSREMVMAKTMQPEPVPAVFSDFHVKDMNEEAVRTLQLSADVTEAEIDKEDELCNLYADWVIEHDFAELLIPLGYPREYDRIMRVASDHHDLRYPRASLSVVGGSDTYVEAAQAKMER